MQATQTPSISRRIPAQQPVLADGSAAATPALLQDTSVDSEMLLRGNKFVSIIHNGAIYRLQSTKLGKLILTK